MQSSTRRSSLNPALRRLACLLIVIIHTVPALDAQEPVRDSASMEPFAVGPREPSLMLAPADVLTPNARRNTPYPKISIRAGGIYTAYSNDRYLDNTMLDVGRTSGETAIYTSAAAFGYGGGAEVEFPLNTAFSILGSADYQWLQLVSKGPVTQECVDSSGASTGVSRTSHRFDLQLEYLRFGAMVKLNLSHFYLVGGVTAAPLLSSVLRRERHVLDAGSDCLIPGRPPARDIIEEGELPDPSGLHYSFRIGIGRNYQLGDRFQFSPELLIDFGFNAINKSLESDLDIYGFYAVLRYELR